MSFWTCRRHIMVLVTQPVKIKCKKA
jgi:hypothetical protein